MSIETNNEETSNVDHPSRELDHVLATAEVDNRILMAFRLVETVRRTLALEGSAWELPPLKDCLQFAASEVGEAVRADIRRKNYVQNNPSTHDESVVSELADCAMMLLSSLSHFPLASFPTQEVVERFPPSTLAYTNSTVADLWLWEVERATCGGVCSHDVIAALICVCRYPEFGDIYDEVSKRLARIVWKHGACGSTVEAHDWAVDYAEWQKKWTGVFGEDVWKGAK